MKQRRTVPSIAMLIPLTLITACANQHDLSIPGPSKAERWHLGAHARLRTNGGWAEGEFLGIQDRHFVLLDRNQQAFLLDTGLVISAVLHLGRTSDHPNRYAWGAILPATTLLHGVYAAFTLPLNTIVVTNINMNAAKARYLVRFRRPFDQDVMMRYARFPQGIPHGLSFDGTNEP